MTQAIWKGEILAESDACIRVEGNAYFPPDAIKKNYLTASDTTTVCSWKGTAHYYNIEVNGKTNSDAAWFYPEPKPAAAEIQNYVAFWKGVEIRE